MKLKYENDRALVIGPTWRVTTDNYQWYVWWARGLHFTRVRMEVYES